MAVAIAGCCKWIDREDLTVAGPQGCYEQASAGLDGHRYRGRGAVAMLGQELQKYSVASGVVADPSLGQQFAGLADQRDVMVPFRPVDPAEHSHTFSHRRVFAQVTSSCGSRGVLIPGLDRSAISVAVRDTSAPQGPLSAPELKARGGEQEVALRRAHATTTTNDTHRWVSRDLETPELRRSLVRPQGSGRSPGICPAPARPVKPTTRRRRSIGRLHQPGASQASVTPDGTEAQLRLSGTTFTTD